MLMYKNLVEPSKPELQSTTSLNKQLVIELEIALRNGHNQKIEIYQDSDLNAIALDLCR